MENIVNIDDFGAVGNGITDDSGAFKAAIDQLKKIKGGTVYIPAKTYAIKSPIVIDFPSIYFQGASPLYSAISLLDGFNGEGAIVYRPVVGTADLSVGVGIVGGLHIHCNNQLTCGIYGLRMYDQVLFQNVTIRKVHGDYSGFYFTQDANANSKFLGQTMLLENCMALREGAVATKPNEQGMFYFDRYQEINLIGCKAFSTVGVSSKENSKGTAFYLKDCRGVTFTGCSAVGAENAFVSAAMTKLVSGIAIYGQTNELIKDYALKIITEPGQKSNSFTILPIRSEAGSGDYELNNLDLSTIYSLNRKVHLDSNSFQNTVYSSSPKEVVFDGRGNMLIGMANYNDLGLSIHDGLIVTAQGTYGNDNPGITLISKDQKFKSRFVMQKNGNLDFLTDENGVHQNLVSILKDKKANGTSLNLTYSLDGVSFKTGRIEIGPVDSAGQGYRQLKILN